MAGPHPPRDACQTELQLSEVSFGAGALSGSYDAFEDHWPVEACREALRSGINLFDTSPYYGKSEYVLGDALLQLRSEYPRTSYYVATKVGRYGYYQKDFDYSSARVRTSVKESMKRLHTDYLDIVYCHDVEFVGPEDVSEALDTLFELKAEGLIKYVGITGYPLPCLLSIAQKQQTKGKPLDIILSYCHYTLQNTKLAEFAPQLQAAGVRYLLNASPLCMALFRDEGPPDWHPAHKGLRDAAERAMQLAKSKGLLLSDIASKFSFSGASTFKLDSTVIGLAKKEQVEKAMAAWQHVKAREQGTETSPAIEKEALGSITDILKDYKDFSWESPSKKELGALLSDQAP